MAGYVRIDEFQNYLRNNYMTASQVQSMIARGNNIDLSDYALKNELPDLSGYALKNELPDLSDYALKNELPDLSDYMPKSGGTLTGNVIIANGKRLQIGDQRPWYFYENGTGSGGKLILKSGNNKLFMIQNSSGGNVMIVDPEARDVIFYQNKPIVSIDNVSSPVLTESAFSFNSETNTLNINI